MTRLLIFRKKENRKINCKAPLKEKETWQGGFISYPWMKILLVCEPHLHKSLHVFQWRLDQIYVHSEYMELHYFELEEGEVSPLFSHLLPGELKLPWQL